MPRRQRRNVWPSGVGFDEVWINTVRGEKLVFPNAGADPDGVSYVRFVDRRGVEIAYFGSREWAEDPEVVMGAILGAMTQGADPYRKG